MLSNYSGHYCECPEEWTGDRCETRREKCPLECLHQVYYKKAQLSLTNPRDARLRKVRTVYVRAVGL